MSAQGPIPPDQGQPAPFNQEPWPGEPGYRSSRPVRDARNVPPAEVPPPAAGGEAQEAEQAPAGFFDEPGQVSEHAGGMLHIPPGYQAIEGLPLGVGRTIAIAVSRFNGEITSALLRSALEELERQSVRSEMITIVAVPGAYELPLAAMALAKSRRYSCVIALGCVIRGETPHFDYVATEAASGLQLAGLETGVPVSFGVLTVETLEQAKARIGKGADAARSALEMADVFGRLRTGSG